MIFVRPLVKHGGYDYLDKVDEINHKLLKDNPIINLHGIDKALSLRLSQQIRKIEITL